MSRNYTKPPKLFSNEYASFREDVLAYMVDNMPRIDALLDPMAGTAPLLPFSESKGMEAHFCDLLPVHFFVNSAKTIDVFNSLRKREVRNENYLAQEIAKLLKPLTDAGLRISEDWIDKSILEILGKSWRNASRYSPEICKLLRAALVLSTRYFSSFSKTGNTTWIKRGGMSSGESVESVANLIASRIKFYFDKAYDSRLSKNNRASSRCNLYLGKASELKLPRKKYMVITSPSFANRYDYVQAYLPELFLLHRITGCANPIDLKKEIMATNFVRGFEVTDKELDFIGDRSHSVLEFLANVKETGQERRFRSENLYYYRYFVLYYKELFENLDRIQRYTAAGSEYFVVVQNNIHRGEVNKMDDFILEYFLSSGFEAKVAKSWPRSHQGRRNISQDHPLVLKKHMESIVWARKRRE